tara:strand:- start:892 stop:1308 length:417 start_codon:yes stop_codon:yes gene_type:complete
MEEPKKLKYRIIDNLEKHTKQFCDKYNIKYESFGMYLRSIHISAPFIILGDFFYKSQMLCTFSIVFLLISFISFYNLDGCLLTRLERKLCGDTFTFVDPFIEFKGLEKNNKSRYEISLQIAYVYIALVLSIYIYRFLL